MPLSTVISQMQEKDFDKMVINLYVGMGSIGRKIAPEWEDLHHVLPSIPQYEPLDVKNLLEILQQWWPAYIRVPYQEFPENIFNLADEVGIIDAQMLGKIDFLSLKGYGYAGDYGTILASGANFPTVLQLGDLLNESWRACDIFVMSRLNGDWNQDFLSSVQKNKKLTVIMDYLPTEAWLADFESQLQQAGVGEFALQWISPKYENLTTIFDEYHREQAEFDAISLKSRL